jgi:class 3 adenylate cyclase
MARLTAAERSKLPDRAFAYVDSTGARRLPIVDAAHVRNALARFGQVEFEDDQARSEARTRLLRAARKYRIVPVGFIDNELRSERAADPQVPGSQVTAVPNGFVTMMLTDIEASTGLISTLGDGYGGVLEEVRSIQRAATAEAGGFVVEERADEFFGAFASPRGALEAAIAIHRAMCARTWLGGVEVRVRIGVHAGYPTVTGANYIGMAVHTAARVCSVAHGGQIVISGDTRTALTDLVPEGVAFRRLGRYRMRGIPDEHDLFQVRADGLPTRFPPVRL